jgi:hypothetical protein
MVSQLVLALLLAAQTAEGGRMRLPPVDECAGDPSFVAFRAALADAVERRDREALLALVADNIELDFGGGVGRAAFVETWELDRPATSRVWEELGQVLRLGCAREPEGEFLHSPSMALADQDYEDPLMSAVAIRPGAELRAAPDATAALVTTLDWDVLTVPEWDFDAAWQQVVLGDASTGFVRTEDLRGLFAYRAVFSRVDGQWRMITFIAGD